MSNPIEEIEALMRRHEREPLHVLQVRHLALMLFDEMTGFHGMGADERFVLEAAALLHDIGHVNTPDGRGHHKWSARMIRGHGWTTIDERSKRLIACVARYHRKSPPSEEHEEYAELAPDERGIVDRLAALLRVADSLDRSHLQLIKRVTVCREGRTLTLQVETGGDITAEREIFQKKAGLFERVFDCRLVFGA
jgi:exopolyphosphatase/guanosine-5'-triphosphate,3'-diphosphate pyrophosphatase